jgi:hypothetical protein
MSGAHFYLTLPSNASSDVFPNNKTTDYRVSLPEGIELEGNWEVGLYSISYPFSWYTVPNVNTASHIFYMEPSTGAWWSYTVQYGHYATVNDLVKAINEALAKNVGNNIKITYNSVTTKTTVEIKPSYGFSPSSLISVMLGFGGEEVMLKKTTESPYAADVFVISNIYVYCDIVRPQVVGDTSAQLLKTIPVKGKFGDNIAETFTNIQYVPVQTKSFETVEILLRTDTGDPVPFERGKVVVTLHFKKLAYFT